MKSNPMKSTDIILATIDAPYGVGISAPQLAKAISDFSQAQSNLAPVFSFFSEVSLDLQQAFVKDMKLDPAAVKQVAIKIQTLAGFDLPLAA